jgi:hypothetical protein
MAKGGLRAVFLFAVSAGDCQEIAEVQNFHLECNVNAR